MIPGPCVICGGTNYELSCGGPTICPKCDCGHFDAATVLTQAKVMKSQRIEIEHLRTAFLRYLQTENACERTGDPCRDDRTKCGCDCELQEYVNEERRLSQQERKI